MGKDKKAEPADEKPAEKAPVKKEPTVEEMRAGILAPIDFAAKLAADIKICKDSGMLNPDTDLKMKNFIDSVVRSTFGWPDIQVAQPYQVPQPPQAAAPPGAPQAAPSQQGYVVPPRTYPGQKPV